MFELRLLVRHVLLYIKKFHGDGLEEKRGFKPVARLGEAICNDEIVNFLKDQEHYKCSCSSVYYNAVF